MTSSAEINYKLISARAEARGREIYALQQKVDVLEEFKKRTNIGNIQRKLSDLLFSILENRMDGNEVAEVMIKF